MMTEAVREQVRVDLGDRSYLIDIGRGLIESAGDTIDKVMGQRRLMVVADRALHEPGHTDRLLTALQAQGHQTVLFELPGGEATKAYDALSDLLDRILSCGIDRQTAIVAFGGGVIGDLAGFAAAILLRGLDLVQIPTTLLSQVDSSVGGKTGINSAFGKNLVGSFHQPKLVLIDTDVLASLPQRELKAGYAEVIKYGCIADADFFTWLEKNGRAVIDGDSDAQSYAIKRSCEIKAVVVADDEREVSGARALLNFGHTFAHAYEALAGYGGTVLHGEAVSVGMTRAVKLAATCGSAALADGVRLIEHLQALGLPIRPRDLRNLAFDPTDMLQAMRKDKKSEAGAMRFVLWRRIGDAFVHRDIDEEQVFELLTADD